jgi:hypothetical protein
MMAAFLMGNSYVRQKNQRSGVSRSWLDSTQLVPSCLGSQYRHYLGGNQALSAESQIKPVIGVRHTSTLIYTRLDPAEIFEQNP